MTHFTKYAEKKFDILNKHKIFYTREQIEDVVNCPDELQEGKEYISASKDGIKVVYEQHSQVKRILTFFPM